MKKLRDVPLRYGVAALFCGGMSLFLFGVVFAVVRQVYRGPPNPAWAWGVLAALVAVVAAAGAFFALLAWGALSDPKSRLGSRFRENSAEAAPYFLLNAAFESLMWVGFGLVVWAGSYSIYLGVAVFLCLVLSLLLLFRRELKRDIEALDYPNDNPRANRLIGKSRERGSYDYRDQTDRISRPRAAATSITIIGAFLFVAGVGIVIANYPVRKGALVPPTKLPATIATARDTGTAFTQRVPSLLGKCEILFRTGQGAIPGVNCRSSEGENSVFFNKAK